MKKSLFTLLTVFAILFSLSLNAQNVTKPKIPTKHGESTELLKWSQCKPRHPMGGFKSPMPFKINKTGTGHFLAKHVGDGTVLYGNVVSATTWNEANAAYGIYSFKAESNFSVEKIIENPDFNSPRIVYVKGKYYVFNIQESWGWLLDVGCAVYNAETGEKENAYSNATEWNNVPAASAMTYDATTGNVYAITYNADMTGYYLSIMNQENGSFNKVSDLANEYVTLAASSTGTLYAVTSKGEFYQINKTNGDEIQVGTTGLMPQYAQSMTFDPATDKLYWAFFNDKESALYEINTATGTPYKVDDMPADEEIVGMYIKPASHSNEAPNPVGNLRFVPDEAGSLSGTISCVAPQTDRAGKPLNGTVKITIHAGKEEVLNQDAMPGAAVTKENHTFAASELYTLYAIASNEQGESAKQSITIYAGKDNAGIPTHTTLVIKDKQAMLTWDAPQKGLNDGFINPEEVSYKIVRYAGDDQGTLVTTTDPNVTSYTETIPQVTGYYSYAVTAMSNHTEGGTGRSNQVLSAGAYELPYYDNFQDKTIATTLYTFIDTDNDGHDNQSKWFWKEDERLMQFCADNEHPGNDWLISPAIHLDGKNLYNLTFNVNMGAPSNLKVTIGTSTNPEDHREILDLNSMNDPWQTPHESTIKVDQDANYYIGFYVYSDLSSSYLNLFDIKLEAGMSTETPDSVHNLTITPAQQGEQKVVISFDAPKTLINGKQITDPIHLTIYRNDEVAKECTAEAGQNIVWNDENAAIGYNTYRIIAKVNEIKGLEKQETVWVGIDLSEPVKDMAAKTIDNNMHVLLAWKAPEKGKNNGYFNIDNVTYSVWRSHDGKEFSPLIQELKELTYTDTQIEQELNGKQDSYYYAVTADTKAGNSEANTKFIVIGTPYKIPEWESFPNGKFHISPWTTDPIQGSFSWECMHNDEDNGMYPQDNDNGFIKFYNQWGGIADSRLKTPVFDLNGCKNPSFSFFMSHWEASSVAADEKKTKVTIEISVDGGEFQPVGEPITAASDKEEWKEHRISLAEYKNAKQVQFGLRGYTDNNWMYFYVDNIRIEEQQDYDLAVADFYGTDNVNVNEKGTYTFEYFNRGLKVASGYTIELYQDEILIQSLEGGDMQPQDKKQVEFEVSLNAAKIANGSSFYVKINYDKDQNTDNNQSVNITTTVNGNWYPTVEKLTGSMTGSDVIISWDAPEIPNETTETFDGLEDYEPFAIDNFGDWLTVDGDQLGSGTYSELPDYPNRLVNQAFQVWAPGYLENALSKYPQLKPRTGDQCLISWYANTRINFVEPCNDDYLISPEILGGSNISFYIRRIDPEETAEYYEIMYSSTTKDVEAFTICQEYEAPEEWQKVEITLPENARYFAIHYIGQYQTGILIDDISYTSAIFALEIEGYNIFRNGQKINEELLTEPHFKDVDAKDGKNIYQVSVVYNRGESNPSKGIEVTVTGIKETESGVRVYVEEKNIIVTTETLLPVSIYSIDGYAIVAGQVNGSGSFPVEEGMYIVKTGEQITKLIVR